MKYYLITTLTLCMISCSSGPDKLPVQKKVRLDYIKNEALVSNWKNNIISYLNSSDAKIYIDSIEFNNQFMAFGKLHGTKGFHYKYKSNHSIINFGKNKGAAYILYDSEITQPELPSIFKHSGSIKRIMVESAIESKFDNDTLTVGTFREDSSNDAKFQLIFIGDDLVKIIYPGIKYS